ncbi:MAG: tRNA 2-thiouridine(34) synthase MnmA [Clostridia bacterium]|nr:tRNA 2-thiouridine(34) synthase MnmA [Clostridia bacterium]
MSKRVVVGMSGGVDSAVAACMLKEQGYEVVGLFMRNWHEKDGSDNCTADEDYYDVRGVCNRIGIPYYSVDFSKEYYDRVFTHFVDEYAKGRTPNPDVLCNREIKFSSFASHAKSLGADYIATGHYAGVRKADCGNLLIRAKDDNKDQTYFLNQLKSEQLDNVIFPLCNLDKPAVRAYAAKYGISVADKKDSTGICFIGERNFRNFLSQYIPMKEGVIKDLCGRVVGRHNGVFYYTAGQRRGLGIGGIDGAGEGKWFVVDKDVKSNVLYVSQGDESMLYKGKVSCPNFNFISMRPDGPVIDCEVRIRHRQKLQRAKAYVTGNSVEIAFDTPQRAPAIGQYAVLYLGDICLGGGVIERAYD